MNQSLTVSAGLGITATGSNPGPSSAGRIQSLSCPHCHFRDTGTSDQIMEIQRGAYPQLATYAAGFTPHTHPNVGNHCVATTSS